MFKVVCISEGGGAFRGRLKVGDIYEVADIMECPICGTTAYQLKELLGTGGNVCKGENRTIHVPHYFNVSGYSSDLFRPVDDSFGKEIAEKFEEQFNPATV